MAEYACGALDGCEVRGSKREQKRLAAAEEVCRSVRKSLSHAATQGYYMNMALDWLLVWIANSPAAVSQTDPIPRKRPTVSPQP